MGRWRLGARYLLESHNTARRTVIRDSHRHTFDQNYWAVWWLEGPHQERDRLEWLESHCVFHSTRRQGTCSDVLVFPVLHLIAWSPNWSQTQQHCWWVSRWRLRWIWFWWRSELVLAPGTPRRCWVYYAIKYCWSEEDWGKRHQACSWRAWPLQLPDDSAVTQEWTAPIQVLRGRLSPSRNYRMGTYGCTCSRHLHDRQVYHLEYGSRQASASGRWLYLLAWPNEGAIVWHRQATSRYI